MIGYNDASDLINDFNLLGKRLEPQSLLNQLKVYRIFLEKGMIDLGGPKETSIAMAYVNEVIQGLEEDLGL